MLVKSCGFTVIEMMIAVAIVGVLAAVAAPSFQETMATTRLKSAAANLQQALLRTRSEAVKRNTAVTLAANDGDWAAGWTISEGIETHAALSGVSSAGTASVTYTGNGRATTSVNISLSADDSSAARCLTVTLGGQPVVKSGVCP